MADNQKIYHITKHGKKDSFQTVQVIDFSELDDMQLINDLRNFEWASVYLSEKQLTFQGITYNL